MILFYHFFLIIHLINDEIMFFPRKKGIVKVKSHSLRFYEEEEFFVD